MKKANVLCAGVAKYKNLTGQNGTILSIVFSLLPKHWEKKDFPSERRLKGYCKNWFIENRKNSSFRYGILDSSEYDKNLFDEFLCTSEITKYFMREKNLRAKELKLFMLGFLKQGTADILRKNLIGLRGIEKITVENAIPKVPEDDRTEKRIICPDLTYCAHVLASTIYSGECFFKKHLYQVPINLSL